MDGRLCASHLCGRVAATSMTGLKESLTRHQGNSEVICCGSARSDLGLWSLLKNMLLLGPMDDSSEDRPFFKFCWKSLKLEQGIFVCYLNCDFPFQPNSRDPLGKPVSTP